MFSTLNPDSSQYVRFFQRVAMGGSDHAVIYGMEILSTYMSTGAVFIHTIVFKKIITNKQGAMLYQVSCGIPVTTLTLALP